MWLVERSLSISCTFHPLHGFSIRDVSLPLLQSRGLGNPQWLHSFAVSKMSSQVSRAWITRETMHKNLSSTQFLRRNKFHAKDTRNDIFKRAKLCTYWGFRNWKCVDCVTSLNTRRCNDRKLHDINNDLTSTQFSRRNVFHAWDIREDILERSTICSYWGFLKTRDWKRDCDTSLNA